MAIKTWHAAKMGNDYQGLVIDDTTGANIAVTYKAEDAPLVAAAPELLDALNAVLASPDLNLENMEAETIRVIQNARAAILKAEGDTP